MQGAGDEEERGRDRGIGRADPYAGGLTKFEPKELVRIPIPELERLHGRKNGGRLRRAGSRSMPWSWTP